MTVGAGTALLATGSSLGIFESFGTPAETEMKPRTLSAELWFVPSSLEYLVEPSLERGLVLLNSIG